MQDHPHNFLQSYQGAVVSGGGLSELPKCYGIHPRVSVSKTSNVSIFCMWGDIFFSDGGLNWGLTILIVLLGAALLAPLFINIMAVGGW